MRKFRAHDFSGELVVVASVSERLFQASLDELRARDEMIRAFREAIERGVPLSELSAETGFSPDTIAQMAGWNLTFSDDLEALAGIPR